MKDVKVYAQNLRSYNIGLDQGRWITLGIEEQELQRILTEQLHLTKNHPDMANFLIIRQILKSVNMKIYMN